MKRQPMVRMVLIAALLSLFSTIGQAQITVIKSGELVVMKDGKVFKQDK